LDPLADKLTSDIGQGTRTHSGTGHASVIASAKTGVIASKTDLK